MWIVLSDCTLCLTMPRKYHRTFKSIPIHSQMRSAWGTTLNFLAELRMQPPPSKVNLACHLMHRWVHYVLASYVVVHMMWNYMIWSYTSFHHVLRGPTVLSWMGWGCHLNLLSHSRAGTSTLNGVGIQLPLYWVRWEPNLIMYTM